MVAKIVCKGADCLESARWRPSFSSGRRQSSLIAADVLSLRVSFLQNRPSINWGARQSSAMNGHYGDVSFADIFMRQ